MMAVKNAAPVAQWIEHLTSHIHILTLLDGLAMTCYYEGVKDVGVAQWIEQSPSKRLAAGSSPVTDVTVHNPQHILFLSFDYFLSL